MFAKVDYFEIMTIRSLDIFASDAFCESSKVADVGLKNDFTLCRKNLSIIDNEFLISYF